MPTAASFKIEHTQRVNTVDLVSDLIDEESGRWREDLVRSTFNNVDADRIFQIPLSSEAVEDDIGNESF